MKTCIKCGESKPISEFYKNKKSIDGRLHACKNCKDKQAKEYNHTIEGKKSHREYMKRYRDSLSTEKRNEIKRNEKYKQKYGLTLDDVNRMHVEQNYKCAICDGTFDLLVVDHCHATGKVRGLLCDRCNVGIGCLKDDEVLLENAIKYLRLSRMEV